MSVQASTIYRSVNPKNARLYKTFEPFNSDKLDKITNQAYNRFRYKQALGVEFLGRRCRKLASLASTLED